MENARATYDLYIQNSLTKTSHTLEWLNLSHPDTDHSEFDWQYFLIGTHADEESGQTGSEKLQIARVRVPNRALAVDQLKELATHQQNLSRLQVVSEFDH